MELYEIQDFLIDFKNRNNTRKAINEMFNALKKHKQNFIVNEAHDKAKEIWCLEKILKIQSDYIAVFQDLKRGKYYKAWTKLEQIELNIIFLTPHFNTDSNQYFMGFIKEHVPKYQSLFPYKMFFSPEFLQHEKRCNICKKTISIRNPCGHEVGEIYNGEMCCREVTKFDVLGVSLVTSPMQKYSVAFFAEKNTGKTIDSYNYTVLEYLIKRLRSPFDRWNAEITEKIHSHLNFKDVGMNDRCPCGSGEKYKTCCLDKPGVKMPHYEFKLPYDLKGDLEKTFFFY